MDTGSGKWVIIRELKSRTNASIRGETMKQFNKRTGSNVPF